MNTRGLYVRAEHSPGRSHCGEGRRGGGVGARVGGMLVWPGGAEVISLGICLLSSRRGCSVGYRAPGATWLACPGSSLPNLEPGALPRRPPTPGRPLSPWGPVPWLPHSPAFPSVGLSDSPSSLHAQMWAFQLSLPYRVPAVAPAPAARLTPPGSPPQPLDPCPPFLETHHSASTLFLRI